MTLERRQEDQIIDVHDVVEFRVDEATIATAKHNIQMMQKAVSEVLEEGIDYGTYPGIKEPFLWDPGASKVRDFFDVYPVHKVLSQTEKDGYLTIIMEAQLIWRKSGQMVASGVGACSMLESKYKYRWVDNPEEEGYNKNECKKKFRDGQVKYRILNPEYDELINTITKMSAKRAEVDAAQSLPGVSTAIAKLRKGAGGGSKDVWNRFWGEVNRMGLQEKDAHRICHVHSMKDWLAQGKTLEEAIELMRQQISKEQNAPPEDTQVEHPQAEQPQGENPMATWDELRGLINELKPAADRVTAWWQQAYKLPVSLSDFRFSDPPEKFSGKMIIAFRDKLKALKEEQEKSRLPL
jgi:hypothetical protein